MSDLNQSAIKKHALACSKAKRAGRFTRVGSDFLDELTTEVETIVRDLCAVRFHIMAEEVVVTEEKFVTGALANKLAAAMNQAIGRIIQQKVQRQPSVGKTLSRTK